MHEFRAASRSSELARIQTAEAHRLLAASLGSRPVPGIDILCLESWGDLHQETSLLDGEVPADFFTRELDQALRDGRADWAVHSAKDLGLPLPGDLAVLALLSPADQSDSLVLAARHAGIPGSQTDVADAGTVSLTASGAQALAAPDLPLPFLPLHARVGTSSPSRRDQLLALRPDLEVVGIRGTIGQRLARLEAQGDSASPALDGVIVASCALDRLGLGALPRLKLNFRTHPLQGHLAIVGLKSRRDLAGLWKALDVRRSWGRVTLVGAGPGDPELITLKGQRLLGQADVILHDALANPSLLPPGTPAIFVGKRKGEHSMAQEDTNRLMHRLALEGKQVVRLKGGDPFVFGRGGEEFRYLEERLVSVQVVPGISSALAMAASTGISLTDRSHGASLAFCTGYPEERIQVPDADTRVYFMGRSKLGLIRDLHLAKGHKPGEPVLLVSNASLPDQKSTWTNLGEVAGGLGEKTGTESRDPAVPSTRAARADEPVLAVFGAAVPDAPRPSWWEALPSVWYTGTDAGAARRRYGDEFRIIHEALVKIVPLECPDFAPALAGLRDGDWVVLTSRHGVERFFALLEAQGMDSRRLGGLKVAAVGKSTARSLQARGIRADLVPARESGRGLVEAFAAAFPQGMAGIKVLQPTSTLALELIPEGLGSLGARVSRVFTYDTRPLADRPSTLPGSVDRILLSSPSAARALHVWYPVLPPGPVLECMGEETLKLAETLWPESLLTSDPAGVPADPAGASARVQASVPASADTHELASDSENVPAGSSAPAGTGFARFHHLRSDAAVRDAIAEVKISKEDCILPLFVVPGTGIENPIPGLDGVYHRSSDRLAAHVLALHGQGYQKILLFGVEDPARKDALATWGTSPDSLVCQAIRAIKATSPDTTVFTDVCVCAYMDHGHCGVVRDEKVDNDASLPLLAAMALAHARAGADWVAPSAMMDGQVQAIRNTLDQEGFRDVGVLGYSAKFASNLYGPFRDAARSAPGHGDRKAYQMDWRTPSQVLPEVAADLDEGARAVMVKPAMLYLDVVARVRQAFPGTRLAAYHVSGEYMALRQLAQSAGSDLHGLMTEAYTAIKRAGADWIIGYGANLVFGDPLGC